MKFRLVWLLPLVLVAALAAGWRWMQQPLELSGTKARVGEAVEVVYATGFVEPRQPVEVASRVTAPIVEVLVEEGQRVVRGQPLARLDADEQRQAIAQLAAQTANAAAEERRTLPLVERGFATGAARDRVVTAARAARAAEAAARARLDQYVLRAGISGVVLRRDAYPGDLAAPNKTLFVLGDPALLRVTATVDERDIPRVRAGQRALMSSDAYPGRVFQGTVRDITPGGDPNQRAFRVRIFPDRPGELPVGLTLEVNIVNRTKPRALLVPSDAVSDGALWTVADGKAVRRKVRTGIEGGEWIELVGGLQAGACVLADPPEDLAEGRRVEAKRC